MKVIIKTSRLRIVPLTVEQFALLLKGTEKDNLASHKVLQHGGMMRYKETGSTIWWKIEKQK